jgi:hypothetical protein
MSFGSPLSALPRSGCDNRGFSHSGVEHGAAPSARDLVVAAPFAISFSLGFSSCDLQDLVRRSSYHADAIRSCLERSSGGIHELGLRLIGLAEGATGMAMETRTKPKINPNVRIVVRM